MKKIFSVILSILIALSAMSVSASAYDYESLAIPHGKKGGEIVGFFVYNIERAKGVEGCEEVVALEEKAYEKARATQDTLRKALAAVVEVEKDKAELEIICVELLEEWHCWAEGLGSALGDPSACARDIDVVIADCYAAMDDAKVAFEKGNWKNAHRALLELYDAEETYYVKFKQAVGDFDLFCDCAKDSFVVVERAKKLREKAQTNLDKANALISEAKSDFDSMMSFISSARQKANELNHPELANSFDHDLELKDDFRYDKWELETFDFDKLDRAIDGSRDVFIINAIPETKKVVSPLLSEFFMTANNLTYNGKEQKLITAGKNQPQGENIEPVSYAIGKAPTKSYEGDEWYDYDYWEINNSSDIDIPAETEFKTEIPTAKQAGTYYVYMRFGESSRLNYLVTKVTIKPIKKKANTLFAKGKTVKLQAKTLKKKAVSLKRSKAITVKKAQGKLSYKKAKGNKKITVAKNGKITVKKGLKKGTYKVKIKVKAAGNLNYKSATKTVTVTFKVK